MVRNAFHDSEGQSSHTFAIFTHILQHARSFPKNSKTAAPRNRQPEQKTQKRTLSPRAEIRKLKDKSTVATAKSGKKKVCKSPARIIWQTRSTLKTLMLLPLAACSTIRFPIGGCGKLGAFVGVCNGFVFNPDILGRPGLEATFSRFNILVSKSNGASPPAPTALMKASELV